MLPYNALALAFLPSLPLLLYVNYLCRLKTPVQTSVCRGLGHVHIYSIELAFRMQSHLAHNSGRIHLILLSRVCLRQGYLVAGAQAYSFSVSLLSRFIALALRLSEHWIRACEKTHCCRGQHRGFWAFAITLHCRHFHDIIIEEKVVAVCSRRSMQFLAHKI
jgi:hypothetical protein